jgi:S1-C subfamily serine protease
MRLGIQGRFEEGYGLVVERVRFGSAAGRLGLESGDVIRAIDGRWLRTEVDYRRQLKDAEFNAQLIIRDVRTGRLLQRPVEVRRQ